MNFFQEAYIGYIFLLGLHFGLLSFKIFYP